jgi:hypothetical protein
LKQKSSLGSLAWQRFTGDFPSLQNLALLDESNDKSILKLASMLELRSRPFFADWTT